MTKAEKMAHDIGIDWYAEDGINIQDDAIEKLIHQVAERGIEEALASFNLIAPGKDVPVDMIRDAIRARRWWEDEEV